MPQQRAQTIGTQSVPYTIAKSCRWRCGRTQTIDRPKIGGAPIALAGPSTTCVRIDRQSMAEDTHATARVRLIVVSNPSYMSRLTLGSSLRKGFEHQDCLAKSTRQEETHSSPP